MTDAHRRQMPLINVSPRRARTGQVSAAKTAPELSPAAEQPPLEDSPREQPLPEQPTTCSYIQKRNALAHGDREWRIEPDALVAVGARGQKRCANWKDVKCVRLGPAPTRLKPWRHVFEMRLKDGRSITIDNAHCAKLAVFEDRSDSYAPFVRAALSRIHAANPKVRALIGQSKWRHGLFMVMALMGLAAAAVALILVPTPFDAAPATALIKLLLVLLMLPTFAIWCLKAFPRGAPLDRIPADAFPSEQQDQRAA